MSGPPLGWYDNANGEIADICAYKTIGGLLGGDLVRYSVSGEWSNGNGACIVTQPPSAISIGDGSIVEGNAGTRVLKFPVTLAKPSTTAVSVKYTLAGVTAVGGPKKATGVDFNDRGGLPGTVSFPVLSTGVTAVSKIVSVTIFGDTTPQSNQTLTATLSAPSPGFSLARAVGTGTILDDDSVPGVAVGIGDASIASGPIGNRMVTFPVVMSGAPGAIVTMNYTVTNASAAWGVNGYEGRYGGKQSGTVTFPATALAKAVTVTIWPDAGTHDDETFTITLSNVTSSVPVTVLRATAIGTILAA